MKVLPAGTPKVLLTDTAEIHRNRQRRSGMGPVVIVGTTDETGAIVYHRGFGLLTDGPVSLAYDRAGKVADYLDPYTRRRYPVRAAYTTYGRVALAESPEEALSLTGGSPVATKAPKQPKNKTEEVK